MRSAPLTISGTVTSARRRELRAEVLREVRHAREVVLAAPVDPLEELAGAVRLRAEAGDEFLEPGPGHSEQVRAAGGVRSWWSAAQRVRGQSEVSAKK